MTNEHISGLHEFYCSSQRFAWSCPWSLLLFLNPDHVRFSRQQVTWTSTPFACCHFRLLKGIASITHYALSTCTHPLTHMHALSKDPEGINWTLEKQLYPVHAECLSQLNKHCHSSTLHLQRNCTPNKKKKNPHARTLCHTIAFVKALSILSLGPLILLPKLANGS